jgi:hypothetical protein
VIRKLLYVIICTLLLCVFAHAQSNVQNLHPSETSGTANGSVMLVGDYASIGVTISGTFSGGTVPFELSNDNFATASGITLVQGTNLADGTASSAPSATGAWNIPCAGFVYFRARFSSVTGNIKVLAKPSTYILGKKSGGSTSLAVGTTAITGGTSGRVLKNNAGTVGEYPVAGSGANVPLIDGTLVVASGKTATVNDNITLASDGTGTRTLNVGAGGTLGSNAFTSTSYMPLAGGTFTGDVTHSGAAIIISGNISTAAWTTSGVRIKGTPGTLTDTTSSGTVAAAYTDVLGGNTIAASSATTFTNYFTQYNKDPIAGTNVTLTNKWAMGGDSLKVGTSNPLTVSNAGVLNATSPVFVTPTLGAAAATTINGNTFTTGTYTLTGTAGKTLNFLKSLTFDGTDGTTHTFPSTSATIARTDAAQDFTGNQSIGLGATASPTAFTVGDTSTSSPRGIMSWQSNTGTDGARLHLRKSRGSFASPTVVVTGDTLGKIVATGYDGSSFLEMASIAVNATGTIASTRVPTQIVFSTATNAAPSVLTTALTLGEDQNAAFVGEARIGNTGRIYGEIDLYDSAAAALAANASLRDFSISKFGAPPGIKMASGWIVGWSSVAAGAGDAITPDLAVSRISAGLLGIGTGAAGSFAGSLKMTDLTAVGANVIFSGLGSDATHTDATVCADSTTGLLYKGSGTLGICLGTSSARFKNSIHNLNEGLNEILALRPVSYFYDRTHGDGGQRIQYGFTAEDTKSVLPALVGLDKAGQPNSVDMLGMLPVAIKAIQELKAEVDTLKAEIQSLKQSRRVAFHLPSIIGL